MNNPNQQQPPAQAGFFRDPQSGAWFPTDPDAIPQIEPRRRQELPPAIAHVLHAFKPRPLSNREINDLRMETRQRINSILALFAYREQLGSRKDPGLEERLAYERADLAVRYFRIFQINQLPTEILINILRYAVWAVNSPQEGVNTRLGITHTCRYWRHVAIADTTLWSATWFRDRAPHTRSWTFLDRAQQTLIDIRLHDTPEHPLTDAQARFFMDRLIPKLHHTRMLIIVIQNWEPILTIMKRLHEANRSGMPIALERFELHRFAQPFVWPGQSFKPVGHTRTIYPFGCVRFPKLNFFSISGVNFDWDRSVLVNLSTLDLRRIPIQFSPSAEIFRKILISSPRLEKLALDGAGPNARPADQNTHGRIILKHLHTLLVANFSLQYALQIFGYFTAPYLNDLTLMNFMGDYTPLWSTLQGEFPHVRILTLYGITCTSTPQGLTTFIGFLRSMPKVAYLRLASVGLDVLQAFMYDTETYQIHQKFNAALTQFFRMMPLHQPPLRGTKEKIKPVLPLARAIEVESLDIECLRRFVGARILMGAPITRIYVGPMPNFALEALGGLVKMVRVAKLQPGARTPEELVLSDLRNRH